MSKLAELNDLSLMFEEPGTVPTDLPEVEPEVVEEVEKEEATPDVEEEAEIEVKEPEEEPEVVPEKAEEVDANPVYNILRDYNILPEMENPTEEQIRESLDNLAPSRISAFMATKPTRFQELTAYVLAKEDATDADLDEFYNKYLKNTTSPIEIESVEDARKYLGESKTFKELYDDPEDLKEALDLLEDKDKLIDKAKALYEKEEGQRNAKAEAERKAAIKAEEDAKAAKLEASRLFAENIEKELKTLSWKEEQKLAAKRAASQDNINKVWSELVKNPKGYIQFANLLTYFKDGNFDSLYDVLEGKQTSKRLTQREKAIAKDTIGSLLGKSKPVVTTGGLEDLFSPA